MNRSSAKLQIFLPAPREIGVKAEFSPEQAGRTQSTQGIPPASLSELALLTDELKLR
jgi:hypothetical protein